MNFNGANTFSKQIVEVMDKNQYAKYNYLVAAWKNIGNKTTISVYPIFLQLSKIFSTIEWGGHIGGLKSAYEFKVPEKFMVDYKKAMFCEKGFGSTPIEKQMREVAESIDELTHSELENMMVNAKVPIVLRNELFYHYFNLMIINDFQKCQKVWFALPEIARRALCFDEQSVSEMSCLLHIERSSIKKSLGDLRGWPLTIKPGNFKPTVIKKNHQKTTSDLCDSGDSGTSSSEDFTDIEIDEMDEEMKEKLRQFENELSGIPYNPVANKTESANALEKMRLSDSAADEEISKVLEQELRLNNVEEIITEETPPKKSKRRPKGKRKVRCRKKVEEETEETKALRERIFCSNVSRRGPLKLDEDQLAAIQRIEFESNFDEADFVPDAPATRPLSFLDEYNAAASDELSVQEDNRKKGFYDEKEVRSLYEARPVSEENEKLSTKSDYKDEDRIVSTEKSKDEPRVPILQTPAQEEAWEDSLRRNAKLRSKNTLETQMKDFIDPKSVGASNFDSKGEFLATLLKHKTAALVQSRGKETETERCDYAKAEEQRCNSLERLGPKLFNSWVCGYCKEKNNYQCYDCRHCGKRNLVKFKKRLRRGVVIEYNKKKGYGFIAPLGANGRAVDNNFFLRKYNIWSADLTLMSGEKVFYRTAREGSNEVALQVTPCEKARRMMVGECVKLHEEENSGWIRIKKGGRKKEDIYFDLDHYESGQQLEEGMILRFEIDLTVTQPRAASVRPLIETNDGLLGETQNPQKNIFITSKPNQIFTGVVSKWFGNVGYIDTRHGTDKVMLTSEAAFTKNGSFKIDQEVEFTVDLSKISQTGRVIAKCAILRKPSELFHGTITTINDKFGFLESNVRWQAKDIYFKTSQCYTDVTLLCPGTRVSFYVSITARGFIAECIKAIS